jgi:predicted acetyltransferase
MKNDIVLVRPTLALKGKALDYRKEHFQHGEEIIYGSELFDKTESYEEWLSSVTLNTNPKTVNENWVVTDTFFALRKSDDKIIGIIDLRHTLNEFLKDLGNCGYSVRPSERFGQSPQWSNTPSPSPPHQHLKISAVKSTASASYTTYPPDFCHLSQNFK